MERSAEQLLQALLVCLGVAKVHGSCFCCCWYHFSPYLLGLCCPALQPLPTQGDLNSHSLESCRLAGLQQLRMAAYGTDAGGVRGGLGSSGL